MDLDDKAVRLLNYLNSRGTAAVGGNIQRIVTALNLSVPELNDAVAELVKRGLAINEPMDSLNRLWGITEAGVAFLQGKGSAGARKRPWWRPW
jgi:predicted transcriptional regulator